MASIESSIDYESKLTIHTVRGQVTVEEIIRKIKEYHSGEITMLVIWDFSEADVSKVSPEEVRSILPVGRKFAETRKVGKTALVFSTDSAYGLGRMYEAFTELEAFPVENRCFKSMKGAMQWLGILPQDSTI